MTRLSVLKPSAATLPAVPSTPVLSAVASSPAPR